MKVEQPLDREYYTIAPPKKALKSFRSHKGPLGSAGLHFNSPQPDTSRSCKSADTGLVCHVGCLFKFPACTGTNLLLGEQKQCVNNLPKVEREAPRPGIEPVTIAPHFTLFHYMTILTVRQWDILSLPSHNDKLAVEINHAHFPITVSLSEPLVGVVARSYQSL